MGWKTIPKKPVHIQPDMFGIRFSTAHVSSMTAALFDLIPQESMNLTFFIGTEEHTGLISFTLSEGVSKESHKLCKRKKAKICTIWCVKLVKELGIDGSFIEFGKTGGRYVGRLPFKSKIKNNNIRNRTSVKNVPMYTRSETGYNKEYKILFQTGKCRLSASLSRTVIDKDFIKMYVDVILNEVKISFVDNPPFQSLVHNVFYFRLNNRKTTFVTFCNANFVRAFHLDDVTLEFLWEENGVDFTSLMPVTESSR